MTLRIPKTASDADQLISYELTSGSGKHLRLVAQNEQKAMQWRRDIENAALLRGYLLVLVLFLFSPTRQSLYLSSSGSVPPKENERISS